MNIFSFNEREVIEILRELKLTDSITAGKTCYLIGDKAGRNPKIYTDEQAKNFLQTVDNPEEYIEDSYADFDNVLQWGEPDQT